MHAGSNTENLKQSSKYTLVLKASNGMELTIIRSQRFIIRTAAVMQVTSIHD